MEEPKNVASQATPKTASMKSKTRIIDGYAAQCERCLKWRVIAKQEEYEEIGSKLVNGEPFLCESKSGTSCNDPDIQYDATCTWAMEKPGLPRTPQGFTRSLVLRPNCSKVDAYYITDDENRIRLRTLDGVATFLQENPDEYKDIALQDFNFQVPKVIEATILGSVNGNKTTKKTKLSAL